MSIRSRVFDIIQPDDGTSLLSRIFDWMITGLILASVIIVFVATFDLPQSVREVLLFIEGVTSIVFTVEYVLRILTADFLYPESGNIKARIKIIDDSLVDGIIDAEETQAIYEGVIDCLITLRERR